MNPDGNLDRQQNSQPTPPSAEIIDVSVVEELSPRVEPLGDVWNSEPVVEPSPVEPPPVAQSEPNLPDDAIAAAQPIATPPSSEDNWNILLDELGQELEPEPEDGTDERAKIETMLRTEAELKADIARLRATKIQLQAQIDETQISFGQIVQTSIADLERQRQKLQISVEQLERRRDRIEQEIDKSFAGASQNIAIRIQGFKDYLVGSLQDLVVIAEEIEFPQPPPAQIRLQTPITTAAPAPATPQDRSANPQFAESAFRATATKVKGTIERYRKAPDYYAPTWQLRRTLEAVHADKVSDWFFTQDGRGAVRSLGSRLQNILVAAAAVSVLRELYGDYLRTLVLANLPERLGDWRRGFQDCLGLSKPDFGSNGGIILFEDPEALVQRADRIVANKEMPLIIIDNSEGQVSLSILQYPLWLAFASDPDRQVEDFRDFR
jgi:hypothetical protein